MIIIGLGNPGKKYENNRHNVGKMFIYYISQKSPLLPIESEFAGQTKIKTFKTNCFMNESGKEVEKILEKLQVKSYKLQDVFIVHDD
jgi:Peptidyl-tRNA hydrolase